MRAVQYDEFGGVDVLRVAEVPVPEPGPDEVLVEVAAAGINPGEAYVREGRYAQRWPSTFPSGQGSDLAGTVRALGPGVDAVAVGDEVLGWTDLRASQAEYVVVPVRQILAKPPELAWEQAGALHVVGATAWAAVRAVDPRPGETVVVSAAAGGVGVADRAAGPPHRRHGRRRGVRGEPRLAARARRRPRSPWRRAGRPDPGRRAHRVDAFIDLFGDGYVDVALALGVPPDRIDTIIDFAAVEEHGVKADGNAVGARPEVLAELAALLAKGELELPVAATYPLERVQDAYRELERRHTRGKIVLVP